MVSIFLATLRMETQLRNFFLIIAPGYPAYGTHAAVSLKATFNSGVRAAKGRVHSIGNGVQPIQIDSLKEELCVFVKNLDEPFGIIFRGHGKVRNGKYFLGLGDKWIPNSDLLGVFRESYHGAHPISIIFTSCGSAAAVKYTQGLPSGSVVIGLSDDTVSDTDVQRWVDTLASKWPRDISALSLLETYLLYGLRNRFVPTIALVRDSGRRVYQLNNLFLRILKTTVPPRVVKTLKERYECENDIEHVATKILNARSEWSIDAVEYGAALVLGLECELQKLATSRLSVSKAVSSDVVPKTVPQKVLSLYGSWLTALFSFKSYGHIRRYWTRK